MQEFFGPTKLKAQNFWGNFRSIFREKFRASKKTYFVPTSLCRRATLRFSFNPESGDFL